MNDFKNFWLEKRSVSRVVKNMITKKRLGRKKLYKGVNLPTKLSFFHLPSVNNF